jgi:hypothetical protein
MTFSRVRAVVVIAVLFVLATAVVITAIRKDTQTGEPVSKCAADEIPVNLDMPLPKDITINVINGTSKVGLADQITQEFANRGFQVGEPKSDPEGRIFDQEIAIITYGPGAIGSAWEVSAYFLVEATMDFRIDRTGEEFDNAVDVILGARFQQLATTTEVNQAIAQIGKPDPEEGTCEE